MKNLFLDAIAAPAGADYPGLWGVLLLVAVVVVVAVAAAAATRKKKK